MNRFNTSEKSGEERFELEAAFGKNANLVELEISDLRPVGKK